MGATGSALLAAALLLLAGAAAAQPTNLLPSADPDRPQQPPAPIAPMAPSPPAAPMTLPAAGASAAPDPPRIEISELDAPEGRALGTLVPQRGGFGPLLWQGSAAGAVLPLLEQLQGGTTSLAIQDLTRRLLLTPADPPQGLAASRFLSLRVAALLASGAAADALDLADTVRPEQPTAPDLARLGTEAAWLSGATRRACATTRAAIADAATPYWERSNLLCQLSVGDEALAALTANAIAEGGSDDGFVILARGLLQGGRLDTSDRVQPADDLLPEALEIALLRLTGTAPPDGFDARATPAALAAIAELDVVPLPLQQRAAEAAVAAGTLPPGVLAGVWISSAGDGQAGTETARRFRTLADEVETPALPRVADATVTALFRAARDAGTELAAARAATPLLERLAPDRLEAPATKDVIRAFVAAGSVEQALSWWQRLKARRDSPERLEAAAAVWPLLFLAAPPGTLPWSGEAHAAWMATMSSVPEPLRQQRQLLFLTLADALGADLAPELRDRIASREPIPAPQAAGGPTSLAPGSAAEPDQLPEQRQAALIQQIVAATRDSRRGEALLAAAAMLSPMDPAMADAADLAVVIRSFRALGLDREAGRLAAEKALQAGL